MWIIGVSGPIASGKSTLSRMFGRHRVPVLNADKEIHTLLAFERDAKKEIQELWPEAFDQGNLDRARLINEVLKSHSGLEKLESILYPRLARRLKKFIDKHLHQGSEMVVLDIPLLMEVGLDKYCHYVIWVTAPKTIRKARVLRRGTMSDKQFEALEASRFSEEISRKRADLVILSGREKVNTLRKVQDLLGRLRRLPSPQWKGKWPTNFKKDLYGKGSRSRYRNNRF